MEVMVTCCAGLDVHQATVVACLISGAGVRPSKEVRTFGTTRQELIALRDWLRHGGQLVAMESTGVYWRPIYAVLEGHFQLVVGNAHHIKNVPGRKTDVKDCDWIGDLVRHGLIASSFVPPRPIRELRDLTRYRRKLIQPQSGERNRLIKLLESVNIKLAAVISDVLGVSGRASLQALIGGEDPPAQMAQLARGRMRRKQAALARALDGCLDAHHRSLLRLQLRRIDASEADLAELDELIRHKLAPYHEHVGRLMQIPGVDWATAATIIAEIGVEMSAFPSAAHLVSWAGLCPGNHEVAGRSDPLERATMGGRLLPTAFAVVAMTGFRKAGELLIQNTKRIHSD